MEFIRDINPDYVKTLFSLKKVLSPLTPRKVCLWLVYFSLFLIGSNVLKLEQFFGLYYYAEKVWLADIDILLMFLFLAIDPLFLIMGILFGKRSGVKKKEAKRHPSDNENDTPPISESDKKEFDSIGLIISCHKSKDVIERTLISALVHFPAQNIYVADNGNSDFPLDNTEDVVMDVDFMINYRWSNRGNKTLAQFLSVNAMMDRDDIKHVMIIDDDTKVPDVFTTSVEKIDDITKGIMFGIRGVDEDGNQDCIWTKWQDLEYKLGDLVKEIQCNYATVLFPHGAVSLWEKEIFFNILGQHDAIFFADDVKMGIFLMMNGYRLYYNTSVVFETEVPSSLIGKSPNYYNQRVRSWDFAEHMCTFKHLKHIFFGYVRNSWKRTVGMRVFQFYVIISIVNDWMKIPVCLLYFRRVPILFLTLILVNMSSVLICTFVWNYWSCRGQPDIQVDFFVILTSPIYRLMSSIIRVISVFHCVFVYWPNYSPSTLREPGKLSKEQLDIFEEYNHGKESREQTPQGDIEEGKADDGLFSTENPILVGEVHEEEEKEGVQISIDELEDIFSSHLSYSLIDLEDIIFTTKKSPSWSWKRIWGR